MFLNDKTTNEIKLHELLFSVYIEIVLCSLKWRDFTNVSDITWKLNKFKTLYTVNWQDFVQSDCQNVSSRRKQRWQKETFFVLQISALFFFCICSYSNTCAKVWQLFKLFILILEFQNSYVVDWMIVSNSLFMFTM